MGHGNNTKSTRQLMNNNIQQQTNFDKNNYNSGISNHKQQQQQQSTASLLVQKPRLIGNYDNPMLSPKGNSSQLSHHSHQHSMIDLNSNRSKLTMGEIGKQLMQNGVKPQPIMTKNYDTLNDIFKSSTAVETSRFKDTKNINTKLQSDFSMDQMRGAGLTVSETEKLRDMKYNLAAEYHRKQNPIEIERGGIYDRSENTGVKQFFIPTRQNISDEIQNEYYKNKQKHTSHINKFQESEPSEVAVIQNIEGLPKDDKRQIISAKLSYIENAPASIGPFDIALKRRHEAKKQIGQRQMKMKAMLSLVDEYY